MKYKVDYVFAIAALIDVDAPHMSTGSTEPRELFSAVNEQLGLGLPPYGTKPEACTRHSRGVRIGVATDL